eukprot:m.194573 g.194573  ORF g.194573 m.194573 type:complete len:420 (+) comp19223_c0_seq1:125-1384(+)
MHSVAMGRASENRIKAGLLAIALFGVWLWPQLEEDVTAIERQQASRDKGVWGQGGDQNHENKHVPPLRADVVGGHDVEADGRMQHQSADKHTATPAIVPAPSSGKWWAQWADGRPRDMAEVTARLDKPNGELASVVCMTALPDRLVPVGDRSTSLTELAVQDIQAQPDLIVLTVPMTSHQSAKPPADGHGMTTAELAIPSWVSKYEDKVVVIRTRIDYGPSTRIVGCMFAIPEELGDRVAVIEVDDDDAYPANFVEGFLTYLRRHPTSAFSLSGFAESGSMVGEAGPPSLHSACRRAADAGHLKCTMPVAILEGFMGLAVMRRYLSPELEQVANRSITPLACFYGDDAYVSFSVAKAGAQPRVLFDKGFNAFTFNREQKRRSDVPDKMYCLTSRVPGLTGSCPNGEAYAQCKRWFESHA